MSQKQFKEKVSFEDILDIFKNRSGSEGTIKTLLVIGGIILNPITLAGALWFYVRVYYRKMQYRGLPPSLTNMPLIAKIGMAIGAVIIWILSYILPILAMKLFASGDISANFVLGYIAGMTVLSLLVMAVFNRWQSAYAKLHREKNRYGGDRFGDPSEYADLYNTGQGGIYIGGGKAYLKQGHIITVAATGSGKGTNLIVPNLLGAASYRGSTVTIDIKGENAAQTAFYQREIGQNVIILNPTGLLGQSGHTYNPLDLIDLNNPDSLIDDASIIAEMIVPSKSEEKEPYWSDRARSIITGLIIHLMLSKEEKTITKIWEWLRLPVKEFDALLFDLTKSPNSVVRGTAGEIQNIQASPETWGSILSNAQNHTDFLKSPALQASLKSSNFNIRDLSNGTTSLYIVIPADKLETQSKWLRMVVTTALLAVVRNPGERVTFILDEAASLGYLPILETYMGLARGYNISLWPIFQNVGQIIKHYGKGWETLIGNSAVRLFFGINDNETAEYVSKSLGSTTMVTEVKDGKADATPRPLKTPGEVKSLSEDNIISFIEQRNPTLYPKFPYYQDRILSERAKPNPYYKGS